MRIGEEKVGGGSAAKLLNFIGKFFTAAAKPPLGSVRRGGVKRTFLVS